MQPAFPAMKQIESTCGRPYDNRAMHHTYLLSPLTESFMRVKGVKVLLHELRAAIHAETKEKNTAIFSTMLLPCPSLCSRKNAAVLSNLQHI